MIEEVILLQRDGTFLGRYPLVSAGGADWAAKARALLGMVNALGTSLDSGAEQRQEIAFGDTTIHFTVGTGLILVSVVQGRMKRSLARKLESFLEDLELIYRDALRDGEARPEAFVGVTDRLRHVVERW